MQHHSFATAVAEGAAAGAGSPAPDRRLREHLWKRVVHFEAPGRLLRQSSRRRDYFVDILQDDVAATAGEHPCHSHHQKQHGRYEKPPLAARHRKYSQPCKCQQPACAGGGKKQYSYGPPRDHVSPGISSSKIEPSALVS